MAQKNLIGKAVMRKLQGRVKQAAMNSDTPMEGINIGGGTAEIGTNESKGERKKKDRSIRKADRVECE